MTTRHRFAHSPSPHLLANVQAAIESVRADRTHGASWLARQSATILADLSAPESIKPTESALQRLGELQAAAQMLALARPSMAAIANTVAGIAAAAHPLPRHDETAARQRLALVHQSAEETIKAWSGASKAIYRHVYPLLGDTIYTHSRSGTAEYVLNQWARQRQRKNSGKPRLFISESHPGNEGVALAQALAQPGLSITLVADAACGLFVGEASAVVIGADSVRADGSIINKVGTLPLALAAREAQVPVYALCETLKIAAPDFPLAFEEMDASELLPTPQAGISVRNVYFDQTPPALISGIITEQGLLTVEARATIATRAAAALALVQQGEQAS